MHTRLIDYSRFYYQHMVKASLPAERAGKFIQLSKRDQEYIVMSPKGLSVYHANIAERFCNEQGIAGNYRTKKKEFFEIYEPDWQITGGGFWEINDRKKRLKLSGSSQAYGKYEQNGLAERLGGPEGLPGYHLIIL